MAIVTTNPATGKTITTYHEMPEQHVTKIIDQCHQAYLSWSQKSFAERSKHMLKASEILLANKQKYATLMTTEMGKPLNSSIAEIEKCAWVCQHFAESAKKYLAPRKVKTEMAKSYVAFTPLGIVFAIMPWNFPFWQVFRFAAPALMAGDGALLKHAPITTGCGLEIEKIFKEAGFPENLFRTLIIGNEEAAKIVQNPKIAAVTLTGSDNTGKVVGSLSGKSLKKIVLELGGSDPYIILEDADLKLATEASVTSRMNNAGQSCIAAKRFLAVQPIREEFQNLVLKKLDEYVMSDPINPDVNFGPLARADLRDHLHQQVQESVSMGAKLLKGGTIPDRSGFYYPATVLTNVKKGMPAYDQELFGPVVTFIDVKDEQEAVEIANDTKYGLSAAIFSQNLKRAENLAVKKIKTGSVYINDFVRSDPRLPFGGVKNSGFGRELSEEGIREFVDVKTIAIK